MEQSYRAVVEKYPDSPLTANACMKLSDLHLKRGELVEAAEYFELFLAKAHPEDSRRASVEVRLERLVKKLKGEAQ
jgi:TolA-binding protein